MSSGQGFLATTASIAASAMLARSLFYDFIPEDVRNSMLSQIKIFQNLLSREFSMVIHDKEGLTTNNVYQASMTYLSSLVSSHSTQCVQVKQFDDDKSLVISLDVGQTFIDVFEGIQFKWCLHCSKNNVTTKGSDENFSYMVSNSYSLELSCKKEHKDKALDVYLPWIMNWWNNTKDQNTILKLFLNSYDTWNSVNLHHPATFDTIAMDQELKQTIIDDLSKFIKCKDYYRSIGKTWKRGYLLYGPPGTGKSSLVAAIANFLNFNIYDLDLAQVQGNLHLKELLIQMTNKSVIVIEDIDCSIPIKNRDSNDSYNYRPKVTLSGLLNFVDGLWSSCSEQRIIIFTTNYKEQLDSALLRHGRMDMHIYMGYCSPSMFRNLVFNYHHIEHHSLFEQIEALIKELEITPATVSEHLLRSDDVDVALQGLLKFLQLSKQEALDKEKEKENKDDENKKDEEKKDEKNKMKNDKTDPDTDDDI
ncbi:P-loop containing nucleoside triphosphate hydrolase protein [Dioscorea alata]|uniref:P-loop containing nucleoside triphosphate hydrolase protein n=1 Tax=Dioscorea alata TaxID=55571 RepID=A0ACB7UFX8_DIOAL|nr:P-loop containing nucleoside triphosphate hydrolase protein [Dioscorea alata]